MINPSRVNPYAKQRKPTMKTPDIKLCPCCEADTRDAEPKCVQSPMFATGPDDCFLIWKCQECGCEWVHGQFNESEMKGGD